MKKYDRIELIADCKYYRENDVYKGMRGTIIGERNSDGCWLVNFEYTDGIDNTEVLVSEEDMKVLNLKKPEMIEYDGIKLIVEKECYAKYGAHEGMRGTILYPICHGGSWLVYFEQTTIDEDDIDLSVHEDDMEVVLPRGHTVEVNRKVKLVVHKEEYFKKGLYIGRTGRVIKEKNPDGYCLIGFESTPGRNDGVDALIHNDDIF